MVDEQVGVGVGDAEPRAAKMEITRQGMSHVKDAGAVSNICACPEFAEPVAACGQLLDQGT
jgi:hypothetical protein